MNPIEILRMVGSGYNPQQLAMSFLEGEMGKTPMGQNLLTLAKNQDTAGLEQIARNMCKEKGRDFDTEFNSFKNQMGIK